MADQQENEPIPINIGNICDGALVEAFEVELAKVIKNIMDPNTEAKAKRSITMTVDFHPKRRPRTDQRRVGGQNETGWPGAR